MPSPWRNDFNNQKKLKEAREIAYNKKRRELKAEDRKDPILREAKNEQLRNWRAKNNS